MKYKITTKDYRSPGQPVESQIHDFADRDALDRHLFALGMGDLSVISCEPVEGEE